MFDVGASLIPAVARAQDSLVRAASQTALVQTPYGGARTDAAMANLAHQSLFSQALMGAVHARLAEIKEAARG